MLKVHISIYFTIHVTLYNGLTKQLKKGKHLKLTIYHTNDIHSHLNEYTRIQSYMTEHRSKLQHPSLYLDIGDHVDLSAPITQATLGRKI